MKTLGTKFMNAAFKKIQHGDKKHKAWLKERCAELAPVLDRAVEKEIVRRAALPPKEPAHVPATHEQLAAEAKTWDATNVKGGKVPAGWVDAPEAIPRRDWVTMELRIPTDLRNLLAEFARRKYLYVNVLVTRWLEDRMRGEAVECAREGCGDPKFAHSGRYRGQLTDACMTGAGSLIEGIECKCPGFIAPTSSTTPAQEAVLPKPTTDSSSQSGP